MKLPANLTILPGVYQFANGKKFQIARYPSGKSVTVPYEEHSDAPAARMIPVPKEPLKPVRKAMTTGVVKEPFKPFQPRRLHVVKMRVAKTQKLIEESSPNGSNGLASLVQHDLLRFDGRQWMPAFPIFCDYHVQYHIDEEVK